jgi:hypothetical protein
MGIKLSKEWTSKEVTYSEKDRKEQLSSLRKKISDLRASAAHKAALKIGAESEKNDS